jgi:hypothetical protein
MGLKRLVEKTLVKGFVPLLFVIYDEACVQ